MAKKFDFRLERVLRYRKQLQQQAEMRQLEAHNALTEAQQSESEVLADFNRAAGTKAIVGQAFDPVALSNALSHLGATDVRLKKARQDVAKARDSLRIAAQERTKATSETEALKTLREQKLLEHRRKNELESQEAIDENVMRKWSRQPSGESTLEPLDP